MFLVVLLVLDTLKSLPLQGVKGWGLNPVHFMLFLDVIEETMIVIF